MDTNLQKLYCMLLVVFLLATRMAAGMLAASLAAIDGVDALELQLQQEQMPAEVVLHMVPASARGSFLLYQLAKAINSGHLLELEFEQEQEQEQELVLEHELIVEQQVDVDSSWLAAMANEFQSVPVYEDFPMDFQNWLIDSFGLNAVDVYQGWLRARSGRGQVICNAVGQCFEVAQILSSCCPF
ncbi:uncharacterized protein LOC117788401 [Drosophila innubila]|uniref:uncharacterized protein LOC117788401 n=1 Tax=Drosophila innubila TaxID=198719 RepID=UPI00148C1294|nr:uncharacterized protein LOC117788401 [Drosophila innubila]